MLLPGAQCKADPTQTPVFMRVRRTAPMFTFNLPEPVVNAQLAISTDICGLSSQLFLFQPIFL
jgi:hypothetical protein